MAYTEFRRLLAGSGIDIFNKESLDAAKILVPFDLYKSVMDFSEDEECNVIFGSCAYSLKKEELLDWWWAAEEEDYVLKKTGRLVRGGAMLIWPTVIGIQLYMWTMGRGRDNAETFLDVDLYPFRIEGMDVPPLSITWSGFQALPTDDERYPVVSSAS
ncbi:hypothetical protein AB0M46_26565 [Dactylosporangium sp. NPDC051485]|uniref:hypothetical protein n=1 Tax=Dactylosporangium sp. NPDC051485 TaxID=3154846 RepID=UPI00341978D7